MTHEKIKEALDLKSQIEHLEAASREGNSFIYHHEPYYDEVVALISNKRAEHIEDLKKRFEAL